MRDAPIPSQDKLCGRSLLLIPKKFAHASRIREAEFGESSNMSPHPGLPIQIPKGKSDVASNRSPTWHLVGFGSK
jgi:hypothetical protein